MEAKRTLRSPLLLLVVQGVVVFGFWSARPELELEMAKDSRGYLAAAKQPSVVKRLGGRRTLAYPVFLQGVAATTGDHQRLPEIQLALFLASAVGFGFAVRSATGRPWLALAAASPLLYAGLVRQMSPVMLADTLAGSVALGAISLFLLALSRPESRLRWAALGAAVFAVYQVRPAYLFLVPLIPCLAVVLLSSRLRTAPSRLALGRRLAGHFAVTLLPLLVWCALRWVVVGHFGVVSFGGINVVGVATPMLTPDLLTKLRGQDRELAAAMLERRAELAMEGAPGEFDLRRWSKQYNPHIGQVAAHAARALQERAAADPTVDPRVDLNQRLTSLSHAVIRLRFDLYSRWVRKAFALGVRRTSREARIRWPARAGMVSLALWILIALARRLRGRDRLPLPVHGLTGLLIALAYYAAALLLVVLVEPPGRRYLLAAELLLPSASLGLVFDVGCSFWRSGVPDARETATPASDSSKPLRLPGSPEECHALDNQGPHPE